MLQEVGGDLSKIRDNRVCVLVNSGKRNLSSIHTYAK